MQKIRNYLVVDEGKLQADRAKSAPDSPRASLLKILLIALGCLVMSRDAFAQYATPLFGESIEMDGQSYQWVEGHVLDSYHRSDTYRRSVEVEGMQVDYDAIVLSHDGNTTFGAVSGAVNGYISQMEFRHYERTSNPGTQLKVNGLTYLLDEETTTTVLDINEPSLTEYVSKRRYTSGSAGQFIVNYTANGGGSIVNVTGNITGWVFGGQIYLVGKQTDVSANNTTIQIDNGTGPVTYKRMEATEAHQPVYDGGDLVGIESWESEERWVATTNPSRVMTLGPAGYGVPSKSIGGSEQGAVYNGYWYVNANFPMAAIAGGQQTSSVWFGVTMVSKRRSSSRSYYLSYDGSLISSVSATTEHEGPDSATLTTTSSEYGDTTYGYSSLTDSYSGWTRQIGSFNWSITTDAFGNNNSIPDYRSDSLYAPRNLLVDGVLFSYASSETSSSSVTDYYYNSSGDALIVGHGGAVNPYQHFVGGDPVTVYLQGTSESGFCYVGTSGLAREGALVVGSHLIVPAIGGANGEDPRTEPFFVPSTSLWVEGVEYVFDSGHDDTEGNRADVYKNIGGTISLFGRTAGNAAVVLNGDYFPGGLVNGQFQVGTAEISSVGPVFPDAIWLNGQIVRYEPESSTSTTASYLIGGQYPLIIQLTSVDVVAKTYTVEGTEYQQRADDPTVEGDQSIDEWGSPIYDPVSFSSAAPIAHGKGVFVLERSDGLKYLAVGLKLEAGTLDVFSFIVPCPSGTSQLVKGLPPGLSLSIGGNDSRRTWLYMGKADLGDGDAAWYGNKLQDGDSSPVGAMVKLSIPSVDAEGEVPAQAITVKFASLEATFFTASRLFQAPRDPSFALQTPIFAVETSADDTLWEPVLPPEGLPASFRSVDGRLWRYSHQENDGAVYLGQHAGQKLVLDPPGQDGFHLAHLTDSETGVNTQGTFNTARQSILMRDGSIVYVSSANAWGAQNPADVPENQLHTIAADLDITGNIVSFGSLIDDASRAGAIFRFEDRSVEENGGMANVVALHSILSRPKAEWTWQKPASEEAEVASRVMHLDRDHRLSLFSPTESSGPAVLINPAGPSFFTGGPLRVLPAGDVPMADDFKQGPPPGQ